MRKKNNDLNSLKISFVTRKEMEGESTKQLSKDFSSVLKELVKSFHGAVSLNVQLARAGPGAVLSLPTGDGTTEQFGKKELRKINVSFVEMLNSMKYYVRNARKKVRKPVDPSSFANVYAPVYVGDALKVFFNEGGFGPLEPGTEARTRLIDSLSLVKEGYMLRNTITMLFYIHNYSEDLEDPSNAQFTRSSPAMMKAFGGKIPADFYTFKEKAENGKARSVKIRMTDPAAQDVSSMNTYDVIKVSKPDFEPNHFNTYFYQSIASLSYYSIANLLKDPELAGAATFLKQDDVRAQMLAEHQLVKAASTAWCILRGKKTTC